MACSRRASEHSGSPISSGAECASRLSPASSPETALVASVDMGANGSSEQQTNSRREAQRGPAPLARFVRALRRKKPPAGITDTDLDRCLNLLDLTTLGVGSTLGLGLYVLAGQVASTKAGPAVVVSFALAALASAFSALCYAEFAGRVPCAGSAYAYSYITVGELVAFIIGWNLVLEYIIGASSVARGFSGYLKFVCSHLWATFSSGKPSSLAAAAAPSSSARLLSSASANSSSLLLLLRNSEATGAPAPSSLWQASVDYVGRHFDWISIAIVLLLTAFILFGVKESTKLTLVFTSVNMIVVLVVVLSSLGSLDLRNWQLSKQQAMRSNHTANGVSVGEGGFMPFGWAGVLAGSSTCFFGFIGFDTIASSAEEARNPRRNVPLSIVLSLFISFLAYMAIAAVQTLLWPYYDQNSETILPHIFSQLEMPATCWLVLLGAIAGLASSQLGAMYPLPRILYSMAKDRLIYAYLAKVNKSNKIPVRATILGSLFIALLACLLDIQELADMVSIGTLAAYSLVSLSVLIIRYEPRAAASAEQRAPTGVRGGAPQQLIAFTAVGQQKQQQQQQHGVSEQDHQAINGPAIDKGALGLLPSDETSSRSKVYIGAIVAICVVLNLIAKAASSWTLSGDSARACLLYSAMLLAAALASLLYLLAQLPANLTDTKDMFTVPLVPLTPTLSILVNICLMINLSYLTWFRFAVWMAIGLFIYFSYGIHYSRGHLNHLGDDAVLQGCENAPNNKNGHNDNTHNQT